MTSNPQAQLDHAAREIDRLSAELTQLRAANAELQRKHGLLAAEVRGWRDHAKRFYYQYGPVDSMIATDAGGALEETK